MARKATPIKDRFMQRFVKHEKTKCWEWTGTINEYGYGKIAEGSREKGTLKQWLAHRLSYTLFRNDIPAGMFIDHLCRNKKCVNPNHLEVVTNKENLHRGNNAPLTHCRNGHELSEDNLLYEKYHWGFGRRCKICRKQNIKDHASSNRAEINKKARDYRARNKEKFSSYDKSRRVKGTEEYDKYLEYQKEYRRKNKAKIAEYDKQRKRA